MDVKLDIPVDDTHGNIMVDFVSKQFVGVYFVCLINFAGSVGL
jgi:hypothetical protein